MTVQVFILKGATEMIDITELTEKVTWSGKKNVAPRTLTLDMTKWKHGGHSYATINNGDGVIFRFNDKELFRGIVFQNGEGSTAKQKIVAYDIGVYLVKNKDTYLFTKQTANAVFSRICKDFGLSTGSIASTGYVVPFRLFSGDTLYDMIQTYLYLTYKEKNIKYAITVSEGKINLIKRSEQIVMWAIESGVSLGEYDYNRSIENTVTQVKLQAGEEKKVITVVKKSTLAKTFGVLQHYEKTGDKLTKAQVDSRAAGILKNKAKEEKTFKIKHTNGVAEIITGKAVYIIIPDLGIKRAYYVEEDKHTFTGSNHDMDLNLLEAWDIDEMSAGSDEKD